MVNSYPIDLEALHEFLLAVGVWQWSRSRRSFGSRSGGGYPPAWLAGLLALAALVGVWFLLQSQFGGQVIRVHLF